MKDAWAYVYLSGEWFWRSWPVVVLVAAAEGLAFLWFIAPLERVGEDRDRTRLSDAGFLAAGVLLQFQFYQVTEHCLFFLLLWFCYLKASRRVNWQGAVFVSSVFCILLEVSKVLTKDGVVAAAVSALLPYLPGWALHTLLLVLYLAVMLAGVCFMRPRALRCGGQRLGGRQLLCMEWPLVLYLFVRNLQFVYMRADDRLWLQLQFIQILSAACALVLIVTMENLISTQLEKNELLEKEILRKEQQQQYVIRKETIEAVNRKYHDLKHYLAGIEALGTDEIRAYVRAVREEIEPYERIFETGNEVMDILLSDYSRKCARKDIRMIPVADGSRFSFVNTMDLCSLLGNALDNAVEAVQKVPDRELREISVRIGTVGQMAVMHFQNYYEGELAGQDGKLVSGKEDSENHGFGLANIRYVAEKYGGTAAYAAKGNEFSLNILLPLP